MFESETTLRAARVKLAVQTQSIKSVFVFLLTGIVSSFFMRKAME